MDELSEEGRAAGEHDAAPRVSRVAERAAVRWGLSGTEAPALPGGRGTGEPRPARRGAGFAARVLSRGRRARAPRLTLVAHDPDPAADPEAAAHEAR